MKIQAFVMGSGRAAQALKESLRVLEIVEVDFVVEKIIQLKRGQSLAGVTQGCSHPVLLIANPHGLHAMSLLEADKEDFSLIVVEKPAVVNGAEIEALRNLKTPVAVCHGYRQMWGIQTLRKKILAGEFGKLIAIEGRYWQSSAAQNALAKNYTELKSSSWKNDPLLGGRFDTLIDIASHWADAAIFLAGESPVNLREWRSYVNAETLDRDTHVHLNMEFASELRAMSSISKTVHGAGNHFEVNVIGQKKSATWNFLQPDVIEEGVGTTKVFVNRLSSELTASAHAPHHGLGWLEGYVGILKNSLLGRDRNYPTLDQHLNVMKLLLAKS